MTVLMNKKEEIKNRIDLINRGEVPEGYKKVHGSIIPKDWQESPLIDMCTKRQEKAGCKKLETLSISAGIGFVNQAEKFGRELSGEQYKNYTVIRTGDFSYNKGNSKKYPQGCIYLLKDREIAAVPNVFNTFRLYDFYNNEYYMFLFSSGYLNKQLFKWINFGVRNDGLLNLYDEDFYKSILPIPPQQEQEKIAKILNCCDEVIELKQKLLKEKIREKKYYILNIFKNNICKQFTEYSLGEICNITTGKLDANAQCKNGKYRFYTCAAEYSYINTYAFDTEALLISGNGAHVGYIHYYKGKFNAYQRTYVLDNFKGNIFFIKYQLDKFLKKHINKEKNAGNTPYIILSTLMNVKIYLSKDKTLEDNIVKMFLLIDQQIDYLKQELDQFKQLKKSLSQLLLTGIVRTMEADCEN